MRRNGLQLTGSARWPRRAVTLRHEASRRITKQKQKQRHLNPLTYLTLPSPPPDPAPGQARARRPVNDEHVEFAAFFAAYPRRVARRTASQAFRGALQRHPELDAQRLVRAAEAYAHTARSTEVRYVPHPARWLTEDRFLEHLGQESRPSQRSGRAQREPLFTPEQEAPPSEADIARARAIVSEVTAKL